MAKKLVPLYSRWSASRQDTRTQAGDHWDPAFTGRSHFLGYAWEPNNPPYGEFAPLCMAENPARQDTRTQKGEAFEAGYINPVKLGYVRKEQQDDLLGFDKGHERHGLLELRQRWSSSRSDTRTQLGNNFESYYDGSGGSAGFIRPLVARKNFTTMTRAEKDEFMVALVKLYTEGVAITDKARRRYKDYVTAHAKLSKTPNDIHTTSVFLPWHREFLLSLEQDLQTVSGNPLLTIPYWDWTVTQDWKTVFNADFLGQPDGDGLVKLIPENDAWVVKRFNNAEKKLPTPKKIECALGATTFGKFAEELAEPHGQVHEWAGGRRPNDVGTMATNDSPLDPVFFLHHANLDRIWAQWQASMTKQGQPVFDPKADIHSPMPAWEANGIIEGNIASVLSISDLGYEYK